MGIFGDIIAPVKDLINGLEKPIHTVESIFGTIINMTEQVISDIRDMITDMENLFNAHNIETMFLYPFKDAALAAVKDVDTLYKLISSVSSPVVDGVEDTLMVPIKATYAMMRSGMRLMLTTLGTVMTKMEHDLQDATHVIQGDFARLKAVVQSIPVEITILGRKIGQELKVVAEDAFSVLPEIPDMLEKAGNTAFSVVRKTGTIVETDFSAVESSIKKRFDNESAVMDLFYLVVIGGIIAILVSVFMATHSIKIVIIAIIMLIISFIIYTICDLVIGSV